MGKENVRIKTCTLGDGVSERTKASRTVAGSNSATGGIFLRAFTVSGERGRHPHPDMADTYGCLLKNSAKTNTHVIL